MIRDPPHGSFRPRSLHTARQKKAGMSRIADGRFCRLRCFLLARSHAMQFNRILSELSQGEVVTRSPIRPIHNH